MIFGRLSLFLMQLRTYTIMPNYKDSDYSQFLELFRTRAAMAFEVAIYLLLIMCVISL